MLKNLLPFLAFAASLAPSYAQSGCHGAATATTEFAQLGQAPGFAGAHDEPQPLTTFAPQGEMITFPTADGRTGAAYALTAPGDTRRYLIVIHEWWGLNDHIKQEAERLHADLGLNVLAVDLYDGQVTDKREEAGKLMQNANETRIRAILEGALAKAGATAQIATIGWCFGGGWSLQTALLAGEQAKACVVYYGMPEKNPNRLQTLRAPVLGIFAQQDGWITPAVVSEFEQNMKKARRPVTIRQFDADHAFANPSNPGYNREAADKAYQESITFIKDKMKP